MDSNQMRRELEKRLAHPNRAFEYDRKNEQLRIEHIQTGKGMTDLDFWCCSKLARTKG